ncbi:MAG: zinc-ribbon domain-containing protein [Clostridiales bacterium]|jgi:hypothetical protein|nr:zinc-ribbon domain-containing protein [Clostridiales bacterium]
MKCTNCGSLNADNQRFCEICGASLENKPMPEAPIVSTPASLVPPAEKGTDSKKKNFIPFIAGGGVLGAAVAVFFIARTLLPSVENTGGKNGAIKEIGTQTIVFQDGEYEGGTADGLPEGYGVYTYTDHPAYDFYTGEFRNGTMDGQGYLQMKEGSSVNWINGSFANGLPHGSAIASYNIDYLGDGGRGTFTCECEFSEGMLDGLYIERSDDGEYSAVGYFQVNEPIGLWFEFYASEREIDDRNGITRYFEAGTPVPFDADLGGYDFSVDYNFYDYYDEYPGFMGETETVG